MEFFRIVPSLPAAAEHTGAYVYDSNDKSSAMASSDDVGVRRMLAGLRALESKPIHKVCSHLMRSRAGFQVRAFMLSWEKEKKKSFKIAERQCSQATVRRLVRAFTMELASAHAKEVAVVTSCFCFET